MKHVTRYLLEMGSGFAFVARQKHFQIGDSDFYADLILQQYLEQTFAIPVQRQVWTP